MKSQIENQPKILCLSRIYLYILLSIPWASNICCAINKSYSVWGTSYMRIPVPSKFKNRPDDVQTIERNRYGFDGWSGDLCSLAKSRVSGWQYLQALMIFKFSSSRFSFRFRFRFFFVPHFSVTFWKMLSGTFRGTFSGSLIPASSGGHFLISDIFTFYRSTQWYPGLLKNYQILSKRFCKLI